MFRRQAEIGQRSERKDNNKVILCHCYSISHLVIIFANWVITTLRVIIFVGTEFRGMFIRCIKLPRKCRGKKVRSSSKKLLKMFFLFRGN